MKSVPNADENRRLGRIEKSEADKLPEGAKKMAHLKKADIHEDQAHSSDWRDAHLHKPE